jgi:hypothetical protein
MLRGYKDLKVYQSAYQLAMEIFDESKAFPKEDRENVGQHDRQPRKVH